jgi:hypothetical protein
MIMNCLPWLLSLALLSNSEGKQIEEGAAWTGAHSRHRRPLG